VGIRFKNSYFQVTSSFTAFWLYATLPLEFLLSATDALNGIIVERNARYVGWYGRQHLTRRKILILTEVYSVVKWGKDAACVSAATT
jgi:hypothetical protein